MISNKTSKLWSNKDIQQFKTNYKSCIYPGLIAASCGELDAVLNPVSIHQHNQTMFLEKKQHIGWSKKCFGDKNQQEEISETSFPMWKITATSATFITIDLILSS